jgi:hypothetical protein
VLAVVQQHQPTLGPEYPDQSLLQVGACPVLDSQGRGHGAWDYRGIWHGAQVHQAHAIGEDSPHPGRDLNGRPGLADPSSSDQRDQTVGRHEAADLGKLTLTADKSGQRCGQAGLPVPRSSC